MEPNPYESPKTDPPLNRTQIAKRSFGLAAILLLTLPAMVIAVITSCQARQWFPNAESLVVFGVPLTILAGLMGLAAYEWRPRRDDPNNAGNRIDYLIATPICVAFAIIPGCALAAVAYLTLEQPGGFFRPGVERIIAILFWAPPAADTRVIFCKARAIETFVHLPD